MKDMGTAVLLAAAGMSTRMGAFKPLIDLGGKPLIDHALDTFESSDIRITAVVTGYRHEEIEAHLAGRGIFFINNDRYAVTDMFTSVKLGLDFLRGRCSRVFIMPADIPLVRPFSIETMLRFAARTQPAAVKPTYRGKSGHPLLIDAACIPQLSGYRGAGGLKGALESMGTGVSLLPLPDPGILMDADTPENLAALRRYFTQRDTPARETAMEILDCLAVGEDIKRHSVEVAKLAGALALRALQKGFTLDTGRIEAAALLHDIARSAGRDHAEKGSALLRNMGYATIAEIVKVHMKLPEGALVQVDERAIVYLADKLVCGQTHVTVQTRLAGALQKFGSDAQAAVAVKKRMADARAIMQRLGMEDTDCV